MAKKNKTQQVSTPVTNPTPIVEEIKVLEQVPVVKTITPVAEVSVPVIETITINKTEIIEEPKKPEIKIVEIKQIDPIEIKKIDPIVVKKVIPPVVPQSNINQSISDARAARTAAKRAALNGM